MKFTFFTQSIKFSAFFMLGLILFACNNDDDGTTPALDVPTSYDGTSFVASTTTESAVMAQLSALTTEMVKGRQGQSVSRSTLEGLYNGGNPNLASISTDYYADRIKGAGGWLDELAKASGGSVYTPGIPQGQGGTLGGYLFDENGLELEQLVEKGLYGAALYNHATSLFSSQMSIADVDRALAVFGATPAFANSGSGNVAASQRDRFLANYGARRDKNDGTGLYSQIKSAFLKLQAATKAGSNYQTEKEAALEDVQLLWEKINAATIINYCFSTISKLSATNPSPSDVGSALHSYSEGVGFLHGWRTIPQDNKRITDAQIDAMLVLMNAPHNGTPTSYKFAIDPANELPKLLQVIDQLKSIYGFSDQEIEDFKKNWVSEQGR